MLMFFQNLTLYNGNYFKGKCHDYQDIWYKRHTFAKKISIFCYSCIIFLVKTMKIPIKTNEFCKCVINEDKYSSFSGNLIFLLMSIPVFLKERYIILVSTLCQLYHLSRITETKNSTIFWYFYNLTTKICGRTLHQGSKGIYWVFLISPIFWFWLCHMYHFLVQYMQNLIYRVLR